ncbi:hypothetical protein AMECASPLE_020190 [Ameca splendens]|uniref:Uncharacterized protein n=1 Tax=Ameca splendens TaxID=208324 RepID=A0ABV0YES1_9TELE
MESRIPLTVGESEREAGFATPPCLLSISVILRWRTLQEMEFKRKFRMKDSPSPSPPSNDFPDLRLCSSSLVS